MLPSRSCSRGLPEGSPPGGINRGAIAFRQPVIDLVEEPTIPFAPGVSIHLQGQNLLAAGSVVRFGTGEEQAPDKLLSTNARLSVPLPALKAGLNAVQVIRKMPLGPGQPRTLVESNVAAFVPPFSTTPIKGVVQYPGDGFSVMKYSKNKAAAFKFIDFLTTHQAGNIINQAGLIPDIAGLTTSNPVNQQMLDFVTKGHMVAYPMMDNFIQVNVGNAADKVLPAVLGNQQSAKSALQNMQQIWQQLPAAQRSPTGFGF